MKCELFYCECQCQAKVSLVVVAQCPHMNDPLMLSLDHHATQAFSEDISRQQQQQREKHISTPVHVPIPILRYHLSYSMSYSSHEPSKP